MNQKNP
jgi:hypothetical protein